MQCFNLAARSFCSNAAEFTAVVLVLIRNCLQEMYVLASTTSTYCKVEREINIAIIYWKMWYDKNYLVLCRWPSVYKSTPLYIGHVRDRWCCPDLISRDANKVVLLQLILPLPYPWPHYKMLSYNQSLDGHVYF